MSDNPEDEGEEVNTNPQFSNAGHPLLNSVVATKLFEMVTLRELRTLRLVCKDWLTLSLPIWRRTVQINIDRSSCNERCRFLQWKSVGTELDITGENPFRNFRLNVPQFLAPNSKPFIDEDLPSLMRENLEAEYRNKERFWTNYGLWIHKLELKNVRVADVDAFKRAIFEQTPNLQELNFINLIQRCETGSTNPLTTQANEDEGPAQPNLNLKALAMNHRTKLPIGWRFFFTHFPNIEKLEFVETEFFKRSDFNEMVEGVENMLIDPARRPNLPITDLRLRVAMDSAIDKLLRNSLVKLKVLHLSLNLVGYSAENFDLLQTVMYHHGNTLKELYLLQNGDDDMLIDCWEFVGGPYVSLTELHIWGSVFALNFHFLRKFPNLKVLQVEQTEWDVMLMNTDWTALERMPHLREFYFIVTSFEGLIYHILSERTVEKMAEAMPNLECFTGQLTNLTLQVVCRNWRQLKKLVILSRPHYGDILDIDDVGITGIVPGSDERVPCVADLQELRHLTLKHVTLIGDASVFDGFLKLPRLSSLNICEINRIVRGLEPLRRRLKGGLTITPKF